MYLRWGHGEQNGWEGKREEGKEIRNMTEQEEQRGME